MDSVKEFNHDKEAEIATVALGCLLHDIGKPIQRADNAPFSMNHSKFGREFIDNLAKEKHVSENLNNFYWKAIRDSIRFHHAKEGPYKAESYVAYIACEADNLASAHDRKTAEFLYDLEANRLDECDEKVKSNSKHQWDSKRRLQSIFTYFSKSANKNPNGSQAEEDRSFYDLWLIKRDGKDMRLNPYPYPTNERNLQASVKPQYEAIRSSLSSIAEHLIEKKEFNLKDLNLVSRHLEELFQFVPPDTYTAHTNDVSLYEHLKLTAAIGSCMFSYICDTYPEWLKEYTANNRENNPWSKLHLENFRNQQAYVLFKADISGIQDFIYNISSKQALKGLRGRSFYLELLCQQIADEILKVFSLGRVNQIYLGGGGFSLLLPKTKNLETDLQKIECELNRWLLEKHDAKLSIAFGYTALSGNDIRMNSDSKFSPLNSAWETISKMIGEKKLTKFKDSLDEIFNFNHKNYDECNSCHKETSPDRLINHEETASKICWECASLISYGEIHARAEKEKIGLYFKIDKDGQGLFPSINKDLEIETLSLEETDKDTTKNDVFVIHDSHKELFPKIHASTSIAKGKDGKTLCFSDFVEKKTTGVQRIGVLRADVDNLGKIFKSDSGYGFEAKYKSLSRDKALSRNLAKFFTHYLDDLLKDEDLKDCITVVYAGGDDLFLVGAWDKVIEAAFRINKKFKEYTLGAVSLSAGISIHSPKFPLYRMAEAAGLAEKVAKNAGKDSLCIYFDEGIFSEGTPSHVFKWEDWENVKAEIELIKSFNLSSAYLYQILIYTRELIRDKRSYRFPRLIYDTARMEEENRDLETNNEWSNFKHSLFEECFETQEEWKKNPQKQSTALLKLRKLETACNYLFLIQRTSNNEKKGED